MEGGNQLANGQPPGEQGSRMPLIAMGATTAIMSGGLWALYQKIVEIEKTIAEIKTDIQKLTTRTNGVADDHERIMMHQRTLDQLHQQTRDVSSYMGTYQNSRLPLTTESRTEYRPTYPTTGGMYEPPRNSYIPRSTSTYASPVSTYNNTNGGGYISNPSYSEYLPRPSETAPSFNNIEAKFSDILSQNDD